MSAAGWRTSQLVDQCHTDWSKFDELFPRRSQERRHDSQGYKPVGQPSSSQKPIRLEVRAKKHDEYLNHYHESVDRLVSIECRKVVRYQAEQAIESS
jgi:hypothetical protein